MLEIRGHARGGQGMVTAFEILAKIFSKLDHFKVQSFPAFGVERTGAPIQAFLRVAKHTIYNRSNVYTPHMVVIFDESLIEQVAVANGLRQNGTLLINTDKEPASFHYLCPNIYTVPATKISVGLGLGSKSLPIVNAAMIGAVLHIFEGEISTGTSIIKNNVPLKREANVASAIKAYESVSGENSNQYLLDALHASLAEETALNAVEPKIINKEPTGLFAPYWSIPISQNKTGNWRVLTPRFAERTPPCNTNCPAGTDVRAFIKLASEQKFDEAYHVLYKHNPFPGICGRVCPHFCEQKCNRNSYDKGVNVSGIERFLGDRGSKTPAMVPVTQKEQIAVIGSGPAGLTAALRLRQKGYNVTVFEALSHAGGMMRTGIPRFRLPGKILDREIQRIVDQGVKIQFNQKVTVQELEGEYGAILVAVGSHLGVKGNFNHGDLILDGIKFLRDFKLNQKNPGIGRGDRVAIIGGGNTAVDVARTALRLGAIPTIYYRRTMKEMPAIAQEVEEALAEGVYISFLTAPNCIRRSGHGDMELELNKMELGEPDASGRRRPVPIPDSARIIEVDHVISAIGQKMDNFVFKSKQVTPVQGKIIWNGSPHVFTAGDMAWGGTVAEAIGSGNKVAGEIHASLHNLPYDHETTVPEVVLPEDINFSYYLPTPRHNGEIYHSTDFYRDFTEVNGGLHEMEVVEEAGRCLHCGECYQCGNCFNYCPDAAIFIDDEGRLRIDYDYCKGCGICLEECPCSAIEIDLSAVKTSTV